MRVSSSRVVLHESPARRQSCPLAPGRRSFRVCRQWQEWVESYH